MSILKKDWNIEVTAGQQGVPAVPGRAAQPGYWATERVSAGTKTSTLIATNTVSSSGTVRLATLADLLMMWPWLSDVSTGDEGAQECRVAVQSLVLIKNSYQIGFPLYEFPNGGSYIAIRETSSGGRKIVALCVVNGDPASPTVLINGQYVAGYQYVSGDVPGCTT